MRKVPTNNQHLFYQPKDVWVGDVMPFARTARSIYTTSVTRATPLRLPKDSPLGGRSRPPRTS